MKRIWLLSVLLLITVTVAFGQARKLPSNSWISLFNGTDLTGWVKIGNEKWEVEDGVIHGQGITEEYGYLQTEKKYQDFHMFLRFKCIADGNSGLYFHTAFRPGTVHVSQGRQFEIARQLGDHTGGIYGDGRGWQAWPAPEYEPLLRPNDWNDFLVKVEANRYVCYLNGIKVLDYTNPKPEAHDGYIALQLHSGGQGDMMFKDLKILDLSHR